MSDLVTRRSVLGSTALGIASAMLAACAPGGGAARPGVEGERELSGEVKWLVRASPAENKGQEEVFEPMIKQKHPKLKIERIVVQGADYIPKLNTMAAAGDPPEIWGFGGNYIDYWARGLPEDLTPYITRDKWNVDEYFQPGLMNIYKINGKYYGLSQLTTFGTLCFYNKKLLDEAGLKYPPVDWEDTTWTTDRFLEYALKLTKNPGTPDAVYGANWGPWMPHGGAYVFGGDAYLPEHYTEFIAQRTQLDSEASVAAHEYRQDLIWKHRVMPSPADIQAVAALGDIFKTSRVAMVVTGGWGFWVYSDITAFKWGAAAIPRAKANKNPNYNDFWIMGRQAKNKAGAWAVMRIITSEEATKAYSQLTGTPPTPRASLDAWLEKVSQWTGMTRDELRKVTTGAIEPKRSQESVDHLFLQFPRINTTYNQEADAIWLNKGPARQLIPDIKKRLDEVVLDIYNQFKGRLPK
ncbi:MAG: hypothetical protein C4345_01260 [Chloroflexota bacterium]